MVVYVLDSRVVAGVTRGRAAPLLLPCTSLTAPLVPPPTLTTLVVVTTASVNHSFNIQTALQVQT